MKQETLAPEAQVEETAPAAVNDDDQPKKRIKKRYICFAVAILVLLGAGVAWGVATNTPQAAEPSAPVAETDGGIEAEKLSESQLNLHAKADGWSDDSTPVIARISSTDGKVDVYHAFKANENHAVKVDPGKYELSYISPINADGSTYKAPKAETVEIETGKNSAVIEATFEKIPAEEVTQEEVESILSQIKDAVAKGDKTLAGDAGKKIVDTAANNAAAAPNVDKDKVTEKAEEAKQQVQENSSTSTAASGDSSGSSEGSTNNGGGQSNDSSTPSTGGNSGGGSASTPDPAPAPTPEPTPEPPAHQHNWVAQTETVNHPAEYEQQWVPNMVYISRYKCGHCGTYTYSAEDAASHQYAEMLETGKSYGYVTDGYYEDQGSYQSVLVRDAWTETITKGYICSGCGAWQ